MFARTNIQLDFDRLLGADYTTNTSSCIRHQVYELTDIHEQFGGFPDTYCLANTIIHQLWWSDRDLDYHDLGRQLNMEVVSVSTIKQPPGCVIPYHRDTFFKIKQAYPERPDVTVRANIFLQDYAIGHFLQYVIDDEITTVTDWQQGQALVWDSSVLHLGANAGMTDKYTMQVSGFAR